MTPLRFGVLGCADIAVRKMIPALLDHADHATLTAVASRDTAKAEQLAARHGCTAVTGYEALLDRADIDAVYVPLPATLHAEWIERALRAGKHVLAEKPLCTDAPTAARLFSLARQRGLLLFENVMFLHHSQHTAVTEALADGTIGELRAFTGTFTIPPKPPGDIRTLPVGGGMLLEAGIYPLRAAQHFLGPGLTVTGAVLRRRAGVVLSGAILLSDATGVPAHVTFGMEHAYRASYELAGTTGRLGLDRAFTPPETYQPVLWVRRQDHVEERTLPADHQFANVVRVFTDAVRRGDGLTADADASVRQATLVDEVLDRADVVEV
ncbi:gfo/Idh/MocA family oxidoreductase [Streptomyces sp. V2]|uniref:Gfo/Idh/MocA family protein n=1 Tax=Streptomyces TaxID=1883 RepID=UPI0006EB94A8|nr:MULTISPECIES: Gfo/Idh/MocA family oxidoreductase [Streptomyces]PWG14457.1 gfo/Idh/MocA family oxidoreductase [Streptomyces sp. V2]